MSKENITLSEGRTLEFVAAKRKKLVTLDINHFLAQSL